MPDTLSIQNVRLLLRSALLCATLIATAACASEGVPVSGQAPIGGKADGVVADEVDAGEPASGFADAPSYFENAGEVDAWYALVAALRGDFDDVCGDTFCEGEYSNLESLRFRCSVETSTGAVGRCVWVFGGSNEEIDPATGAVTVDGQIFTCEMPLAAGTDIRDLMEALGTGETEPIRAPLPGSDRSLYDGLTQCL